MNGLYMRLAAVGVRKNGKSYIPYILTAAVMASIMYIMSFLSNNPFMDSTMGGSVMKQILFVGTIVMSVFSLIFLFYTNSFLIRRRKKEFGLYNILGLKKPQIACVLIWETLLVYALSVIAGLGLGILFSKLAEQLATKMLRGDVSYVFTIDIASVILTLAVFAVIFFLILLNSLRQLFFSRPIELLRSGNTGEKPPKTNIPFAVLGLLMLIAAYYMAVTLKEPGASIIVFMLAVIMVILATYMLFVAGSVALCAVLKKNKRFYYRTEHFVSVSQMSYRMRKNGAGLASICILATMVLVTISSTATLYFGVWDYVNRGYPNDIEVIDFIDDQGTEQADFIERTVLDVCKERNVTPKNLTYEYVSYVSVREELGSGVSASLYAADVFPEAPVRELSLADGEIAYYEPFSDYMSGRETITLGGTEFSLKRIDKDLDEANNHMRYSKSWETPDPVLLLFINNRESLLKLGADLEKDGKHTSTVFTLGFDVPDGMTDDEIMELKKAVSMAVHPEMYGYSSLVQTKIEGASNTFGVFGGMFFLGILLGSVFLLAAILIMYYKQITEGYEDAARFEILHKVGMSRREIKKTISSQVLTVFFLPLIAAGVHMAFAFAILSKAFLLMEMRPSGTGKFALVTLGCYLLFSAVYIIVYKLTSSSYSRIVNK